MRTGLKPFIAVSTAALLVSLAGCGTGVTPPAPTTPVPTTSSATGLDTPVIVWAVQSGQSDSYQAGVDRWNAANPDRPIVLRLMPDGDYQSKIRVALDAGQGPDLIFSRGGGGLKDLVAAGHIDPLDSYIAQYPALLSKYLPSTMTPVLFGGLAYGVPIANIQPVVVYYNRPVFADANAKPAATWDDMTALVSTFRAKGVAPFTLAGQSKWPDLPYLEYLVDRIGGPDVFNRIAADTPGSWSDPAVIKALTMIQALVKAHGFTPDFSSLKYETGDADALLYKGEAAMLTMPASAYASIDQAAPGFVSAGNLAYTTFPTVTDGVGDASDIVGNPPEYWSLNAKATDSHKAAAVQFLAEQVENEQWAAEIIGRDGVPPTASAEYLLSAPGKEFAKFCFDLVKGAKHYQMSWDQALASGDTLSVQLDLVFQLKITPSQFADEMNKTIKV